MAVLAAQLVLATPSLPALMLVIPLAFGFLESGKVASDFRAVVSALLAEPSQKRWFLHSWLRGLLRWRRGPRRRRPRDRLWRCRGRPLRRSNGGAKPERHPPKGQLVVRHWLRGRLWCWRARHPVAHRRRLWLRGRFGVKESVVPNGVGRDCVDVVSDLLAD